MPGHDALWTGLSAPAAVPACASSAAAPGRSPGQLMRVAAAALRAGRWRRQGAPAVRCCYAPALAVQRLAQSKSLPSTGAGAGVAAPPSTGANAGAGGRGYVALESRRVRARPARVGFRSPR